jgi:hypothetical protein
MMRCALAFSLCLVLLMGCGPSGPKKYVVTGSVTIDDQPLPQGDIVFMPADGQGIPAAAKIQNGQYRVEVLPGKKKVEITATREEGAVDPAMGMVPKRQYIAAKYNTETELEADVQAASGQTFHFQVEETK